MQEYSVVSVLYCTYMVVGIDGLSGSAAASTQPESLGHTKLAVSSVP